jgi:hypothetical protein
LKLQLLCQCCRNIKVMVCLLTLSFEEEKEALSMSCSNRSLKGI